MIEQRTQANHYVPQSYLKRWAGENGKIWTSRLLVPDARMPLWKQASVRGLANHQNLYTRLVAGKESDEIEHWLNQDFETPAQASLDRAVADERLSAEDWQRIIKFLAAQDMRTPARMLELRKRWEQTLQSTVEEAVEDSVKAFAAAKASGEPLDIAPHPFADYIPVKITTSTAPDAEHGTLQVHTIAGRGLWLFSLRQLLTNTLRALLKQRWTILKCPEGMSWLTTDDPVVKLNYYSSALYDFNGGWGKPGTEIFMPLGPRHMLYMKVGARPPAKGTILAPECAQEMQRFAVEHAHRYVFSGKEDADLQNMRPRRVSAEAFSAEASQWKNWHDEQAKAEQDLRKSV